jgi:prophage DNA circulation protein
MDKADAEEAAGIVQRMMIQLAATVPSVGRMGSDARTAISDVRATAYLLLRADALGPPINGAFVAARTSGATQPQLEAIRTSVEAETPQTLGGVLIQNIGIELCLVTEAEIIAATTFVSRQDVAALKKALQNPFQDAIEIAADDMDQLTYQGLTALYAAVTNHLVTTARPLPQLLNYQFAQVMTTLTIAYRLYADATRADEIRAENKIVHPAFCPLTGVALSA